MGHDATTPGDLIIGGILFVVVSVGLWRLAFPELFGPDRGGSRSGFGGRGHYLWSAGGVIVFVIVGVAMFIGGLVSIAA